MDIIFDVGEIGWSMYHRFYLLWRYKIKGERPPDVGIWTLPDRMRIYEPGLWQNIRCDLPYEMLSSSLVRNSFLYNDGPPVERMFRECGIDPDSVIHGWRTTAGKRDWAELYAYKEKQAMMPFKHHPEEFTAYSQSLELLNLNKENIILMPRFKVGSPYSERRNWGSKNWQELHDMIVDTLDYNVLICGKRGESYNLTPLRGRSVNLLDDSPLASIICALNDSQTILCVSSQSFGGKLALLQNVDTIMWGHQKQRHQRDENWSTSPNTECRFLDSIDYKIPPYEIYNEIKRYLKDRSLRRTDVEVL